MILRSEGRTIFPPEDSLSANSLITKAARFISKAEEEIFEATSSRVWAVEVAGFGAAPAEGTLSAMSRYNKLDVERAPISAKRMFNSSLFAFAR